MILISQLLDLSEQALNLRVEIARLRKNIKLKNQKILRHEEPAITLIDDKKLYYCSHCWDSENKLIQINCHKNGVFICPHCNKGNYTNAKKKLTI